LVFLFGAVYPESSVCLALDIPQQQLILDGFPAPVLEEGGCVAMPYCDNSHVLSYDEQICNNACENAEQDLRQLGFTVHEEKYANTHFKTLGGVVDDDCGEVRATVERLWALILALSTSPNTRCTLMSFRGLLRHAMVVCTMNRYGMCIFRHLYDFVQIGGGARFLNLQAKSEC
jgi:hypothetical protein